MALRRNSAPQYGDVSIHDTFPKLLAFNARTWPDEVAMREKEFGIWKAYSWAEYQQRVKLIALGMHGLGLQRGDTVALVGDNRPEWVWSEVAAHALGAMSLGIYQDSIGDEVTYLLNYAQAKIVVAEDEEQVDKLLDLVEACPSVRSIVYCDPRGIRRYSDPRLIDMAALSRSGEACDAEHPSLYDKMVADGRGSDLTILCTTSGTVSKPKMAILQSGPFLDHCLAYLRRDPKLPSDNYVSALPLPWIMEQVYAVAQSLISRITVNFVEEQETMMADLREVGPTFLLLAPRVWESIAADVRSRMMDASRTKRALFNLGMKLGMRSLDAGRRSCFGR